jgi:hypothetical protein
MDSQDETFQRAVGLGKIQGLIEKRNKNLLDISRKIHTLPPDKGYYSVNDYNKIFRIKALQREVADITNELFVTGIEMDC